MEFRVLGPVEVWDGGRPVPLPGGRVGALLSLLLLRANQVVSRSELIERLWDDNAPQDPRSTLHTYISRLRELLGRDTIRTSPVGYGISATSETLDLLRFRAYVEQASGAEDPAEVVRLLGLGLNLWRGEPLAGFGGRTLIPHTLALADERLDAMEQLIEARLRLGGHRDLVPELTALTRHHPLRERFWAQLMIAQYRAGRQGDALSTYTEASKRIAAELGLDPGPELRGVHQSVLTADPALLHATPPAGPPWTVHCQLPPEPRGFVGRSAIVDELERLIGAGVPVVAVTGAPGMGKTALAVRAAYRLRADFPDGQWYLPLSGVRERPRPTGDALAELLRTSGVEPHRIPDDPDARASDLRSRLADRRVLIVLDDARDAEQVRPLLPANPGSAVLVTSRSRLTGLAALDGAHTLTLGPLEPDEALALLTGFLGASPVEADPAAAAELVRLCGGMPLALRIAAANLAARPGEPIAAWLAELGSVLDKLVVPAEPATAVRSAFAMSYHRLPAQPQRCFRLLGVGQGADFHTDAVAALLGSDRRAALGALEILADCNLVQRTARDRYAFHDLLRRYAAELVETDSDRDPAARRLFDWYLRSARAAVSLHHPPPTATPEPAEAAFDDATAALAWLDAERGNLVATVRDSRSGWQLAEAIRYYLQDRVHVDDLRTVCEAGLRTAEAAGELAAAASMHVGLGSCRYYAGDLAGSAAHADTALDLYRKAGSLAGEVHVLSNLGVVSLMRGDLDRAAELFENCLLAARDLDLPRLRSMATVNLAEVHLMCGRPEAAGQLVADALSSPDRWPPHDVTRRVILAEALRMQGKRQEALAELAAARAGVIESGSPHQRGWLAGVSAAIHADLGKVDRALMQARSSLSVFTDLGDPWETCHARNILGDVLTASGRPDQAAEQHRLALRQAERSGYRSREAESALGLARAALASGDLERAIDHAHHARTLAGSLGMQAVLRDAHDVLTDAGAVPRHG